MRRRRNHHIGLTDERRGNDRHDPIKHIGVQDNNYLRILNASVDLGEASTIALAVQMPGHPVMILDDLKARKLAKQLDLKYTGLLGILLKAKQKNVIASVTDILASLNK